MGKQVVSHKNIGEMLLKEGLINESQLTNALKKQKLEEKSLPRILVELGYITEGVKMSFLKKLLGYEIVPLKEVEIDQIVLSCVPRAIAFKHCLIPIDLEKDALVVAMEDPSDIVLIDTLKTQVGRRIRPVIASLNEIEEALHQYPPSPEKPPEAMTKPLPVWYRFLKYCSFPILCFFPLGCFIYFLINSQSFQNFLTKHTKFDIFLYTLLGWGMWALILYEINGLVFYSKEREIEAEEEAKRKAAE